MSDELSILLLDLAAALDVYSRDNPHVTAFETLEQSDGADAVLSSSAAEVWEEVLKIDPGDHLALHHLAVIHHGRGYQLHLAGGVKQLAAVASWRQALAAWESLLRHDEFWTELRAGWQRRDEQGRADKRRDMLAERLMLVDLGAFRRQLPGHLLSVQVSIFKDNYQSDPALAAQHVKLIRESGFEPKLINRLCDDLYATFVTATNELCAGFKFAEARQAVEGYLAVDPVHPAALRDMLQIAGQHYKRMKAEEPPVSLEQQRRALEESQPWADKLAVHGDPAHSIFDAKSLRDYYLAIADLQAALIVGGTVPPSGVINTTPAPETLPLGL